MNPPGQKRLALARILLKYAAMIRHRRLFPFASLLLLFPALAQAHPGHGGHELTWDFNHLAAHPFATLECLIVLAAGVWFARQIALWGGLIRQKARSRDKA